MKKNAKFSNKKYKHGSLIITPQLIDEKFP